MTTTLSNDGGEIVQLPVPRQYLPQVVQALADAMNPRASSSSAETDMIAAPSPAASNGNPFPFVPSASGKLPDIPWTFEDLQALSHILTTRPVPHTMLDLTAAQPDTPVTFQEIYKQVGTTHAKGRAAMAGLTQFVRRRFRRNNWPVIVEWGLNNDAQIYYRMTPEVAEMWRRL